MFDRFTDRARKAIVYAKDCARDELKTDYLGTEHILLGILREGAGIAASILQEEGVEYDKVLADVKKIVFRPPFVERSNVGDLVPGDVVPSNVETSPSQFTPFSPSAKKALERAINAAQELQVSHVGTEHLLLGLLDLKSGIAYHILQEYNIERETVLTKMNNLLKDTAQAATEVQDKIEQKRQMPSLSISFKKPSGEGVSIEFSDFNSARAVFEAMAKGGKYQIGSLEMRA